MRNISLLVISFTCFLYISNILACTQVTKKIGEGKSLNSISEISNALKEGSSRSYYKYKIENNFFARILKGSQAKHFEQMSDDINRKIVFFMDSSGIQTIINAKNHKEALKIIGYPEDYIRTLIGNGNNFKIIVFKDHKNLFAATWDDIPQFIKNLQETEEYRLAASMVEQQLPNLKKMTFDEIQEMTPFNISEVFKRGRSNPDFMSLERYIQTEGNIWETRAFLFHEGNLNSLFAGNGKTMLEDGSDGINEFIGTNFNINELNSDSFEIIDLLIE